MDGIRQAGGLPVMLPLTHDPDEIAQLAGLCCGFLLTGGHDVSPARYGQAPLPGLIADCPARDEMEQAVLAHALTQDKPVLGICRGIQLINVLLGGTLYQDLPRQHPSDVTHHQRPPYDVPSHTVRLVPGTPLHDLLGRDTLAVNSYHHQAIDRLADWPDCHGLCAGRTGGGGLSAVAAVFVGGSVAPGVFLARGHGQPRDSRAVCAGDGVSGQAAAPLAAVLMIAAETGNNL